MKKKKNLAVSVVLEIGCFYNQNEVMLNVTLEHHSTGFVEEIALCPASKPPSHLYGS